LLALGLISGVVYVYLYHIVPILMATSLVFAACTTVVGLWILFNLIFNYYHCVTTSPGYTNKSESSSSENNALMQDGGDIESQTDNTTVTNMCKKCQAPKPARAHHCHVCKRCVLAMDHHCPWMANCVGFYNYRYFFLFLHYMFWGCFFIVLVTAPLLYNGGSYFGGVTSQSRVNWVYHAGAIMFPFTICLSVGIAVFLLYSWHVYLVLSAQTTIEFYQNQMAKSQLRKKGEVWSNKYDEGRKKNFEAIFGKGKYWFSWMLPSTAPPSSDGKFTSYKMSVNESLFEESDKVI